MNTGIDFTKIVIILNSSVSIQRPAGKNMTVRKQRLEQQQIHYEVKI
jgi:hypothetical protein